MEKESKPYSSTSKELRWVEASRRARKCYCIGVKGFLGILALAVVITFLTVVTAEAKFEEVGGKLSDGTEYLMRVPPNWNKTLVRDLDFVRKRDNAESLYLLNKGYAMSGLHRHPLRAFKYDPAREIMNLSKVQDIFSERFGKADRVIQHGCSGGGHVSLCVAEDFSDRVDGVIAWCAHTPVWLMNTFLDGWFSLKALIDPKLVITSLPRDAVYGSSGHGMMGAIPIAWRNAIDAAQQTPEGRARIALSFTIGQWPACTDPVRQPDLEDVVWLQESMYHMLYRNAANPGGEARYMFENAAWGEQLSWNTGVDYVELFNNGNEFFKRAVRQLYQEAGLDLQTDLKRINEFPRLSASDFALDYWKAPGRNVVGNPMVPLLRLHSVGDYQVPPSLVEGYSNLVRANGKDDVYRPVYFNAPLHCKQNVAETAAAFAVMKHRLDTGIWGSTDPDELNKLAASLGASDIARFMNFDKYKQGKYNRAWVPK